MPSCYRMSFQRERERERTRNDAAPVIRNFIWEGNESGGGRDWFSPSFFFSVIRKKLKDWKRTPGWNVRAFLMKVAIAGARFWWNFVNWQMRSISSKRKDTSNRLWTNVIDTNQTKIRTNDNKVTKKEYRATTVPSPYTLIRHYPRFAPSVKLKGNWVETLGPFPPPPW